MNWRIKMLVLLALVCAFGLFDHSLWSGNDSREGAMISEMVRTRSWVTPVFNGVHYLEKPPLFHWTGVLFCRLFGVVNEGLVRLPAALYGFGALMVILELARALNREAAGFAAAFMCATSALFFEYTRIVLTDAALTFGVVFSLWLFWRAQTAENLRVGHYLLFLFVSAFSFYVKGLVGPGLVWLAVIAWLSFQKRFRFMLLLVSAFMLVFALVLAPWVFALWKTGGGAYLAEVFWTNQFGRFLYFDDPTMRLDPYLIHKEPVYFYALSLPLRLFPWTLLVVPAIYYWFRRNSPVKGDLALFLKTSLLAFVFLLHVSSAKAAAYAMPLFPIIFLMTGIWLEDASSAWSATSAAWSSRVGRRLIIITFYLTLIAIIAVPVAYLLAFLFRLRAVWAPGTAVSFICFLIALIALASGLVLERKIWLAFAGEQKRAALLSLPAVVAVIGLVGSAAFMPAIDFYRTYVPFASLLQTEINSGRRIAFASDSERDLGAFMFYLNSRLDTVSVTNSDSLNGFLRAAKAPAGIVVPTPQLKSALLQLRGVPFSVKPSAHGGKKSDSFRLIVIDPDKKMQENRRARNPGA